MSRIQVLVARRVKASESDAWIGKHIEAALLGARFKKDVEIGVTLVGDREMRKLNRAWRGFDRTTDVLAFEEGGVWPAGKGTLPFLGDIVVSIPQVRRQAKGAFRQEFALMLVHGTLHLLGYDHMTKKDKKEMFSLQERTIRSLMHD